MILAGDAALLMHCTVSTYRIKTKRLSVSGGSKYVDTVVVPRYCCKYIILQE